MSETPEPSIAPASPQPVGAPQPRPDRLYQAAALVAIVAGIVFIVVTIVFFVGAMWCGR